MTLTIPQNYGAVSFRKIFFSAAKPTKENLCGIRFVLFGKIRKSDSGHNRIFATVKKRFFRNDSSFGCLKGDKRTILYSACLFLLLLLAPLNTALAVQPDEMLSDPVQEARARAISADLRCLVCQNQSIDDSDADLAHDLRVLVRQRLLAGDSDAQVRQYLVDRYGDYVLLNPPFKSATLVLWFGAPILLLTASGAALLFYRRRKTTRRADPGRPLMDAEKERLAGLIDTKMAGRKRT